LYKNAKIDTQSNSVIHRQDFDRLQHVCNLVLLFEGINLELQIETVWFIKKSCSGDGFQRWHQDLNANGQVVATIVLNIDSIPTEEIVDAIKQSSSSLSSSSSSSSSSLLLSPKDNGSTTVTTATAAVVAKAAASALVLSPEAGFDLFAEEETCQDIDLAAQTSLSHRSPERKEEMFAAASTTAAYRVQYDAKQGQAKLMHVKTPPQIIIPMLPKMAMFPGEIVKFKNNTWICHGCDQEVANGKKRCRCGCWRDGVRGPTKKKPNTEVKKAPNYKKAARTSNAEWKQKNEVPLDVKCSGVVAAADGLNIKGNTPTCSPLTGGKSVMDEDPTDNDSIQTLSTAARQRESDLDVVVLLNQQDQIEKGDGGDSDIKGEGVDVAMSFIESMVEVDLERENEEGYIIEREVECDDNTAVEGATLISNNDTPLLWGAPPNWIPPQVPPNWKPTRINVEWGEPIFDKVDNPGGWSEYTYQPVFNKEKKKYLFHTIPSGATVVPKDTQTGKWGLN
jgi:hypothetical protein